MRQSAVLSWWLSLTLLPVQLGQELQECPGVARAPGRCCFWGRNWPVSVEDLRCLLPKPPPHNFSSLHNAGPAPAGLIGIAESPCLDEISKAGTLKAHCPRHLGEAIRHSTSSAAACGHAVLRRRTQRRLYLRQTMADGLTGYVPPLLYEKHRAGEQLARMARPASG